MLYFVHGWQLEISWVFYPVLVGNGIGTAVIGLLSVREHSNEPIVGATGTVKSASLVVFALLGLPLAITFSVPFSVTAELTADTGGGQGLAIGVLNLAIVVPQMIVSLGAAIEPAFVLASISAFAADVVATRKLPDLSRTSYKSTVFHFG